MPFYPSSATAGTSAGAISVSNLTSYQELKDITVGYGTGTGDTTAAVYNSAGKYPTDVTIGGPSRANNPQGSGAAVGSSAFADLITIAINAQNTLRSVVQGFSVSSAAANPQQQMSLALQGNTYHNLQSKLEKVNRELNILANDLGMVIGDPSYRANIRGTGFANGGVAITTAVGRYPSSWNRYSTSI